MNIIPIKLMLSTLNNRIEKELNKKINGFDLIVNIRDKSVYFEIEKEKKTIPDEMSSKLFNAINLYLQKEGIALKEDETFSDYEIEGCIITYHKQTEPGAKLLIRNQKTNIPLKIEKSL